MTHHEVAAPGARLHVVGAPPDPDVPADPRRPALFLVPGYTDHVGRYGETFAHFRAAGHPVWGMDLRGHGRSSGPRGFVRRFADYVDDLAAGLSAATEAEPGRRWVPVGHSTGGLVALKAVIERGGEAPFDAVAGVVVTCPLLKLRRRVSVGQRLAGRVGSRLFPRLSLPALPGYAHSHDPEAVRARAADPMIFVTVNARWYTESLAAAAAVAARAEAVPVPLLALQAGADPVVDPAATRAFAARCPQGRYIEYPDMYHEVLLELDRARVWADVESWLAAL